MEQNKKELLLEQVAKIDGVLKTLETNFDCENEIHDEYSFLSIVKENLQDILKG